MIRTMGYQTTFVYTGIGLGALIFLAGQFLTHPPRGFTIVTLGPQALEVPVGIS